MGTCVPAGQMGTAWKPAHTLKTTPGQHLGSKSTPRELLLPVRGAQATKEITKLTKRAVIPV